MARSIDLDVAEHLEAQVDPELLAEVLTNLLRNAGEACSGQGHIEVAVSARDRGLVVEVTDDGPGVPEHLRDEIFRPFRSFKEHGTGIGLAFSRKVVESHGGTIVFVDKPGVGACFRIEIAGSGYNPTSDSEVSHE